MNLPRMRTIDAAAAYLKEQDADTAITKTALRRLVITGALPSVRVGAKYLINLEQLERYLEAGSIIAPELSGKIRRIS